MKFVLLAAVIAAAIPAGGQVPAATAEAAGEPIVIGSTHKLTSAVLGDEREINVRLPAGYDTGSRAYPVVYLLDGARSQDFDHIAGLAQLGELSGTFGPFILVGVETRDRRAELTSPPSDPRYVRAFPQAGQSERFRRFLADEVFPFIAGRYRVQERRAIMGESLAGLFVVETLLSRPAMFQDYIAVSPSLWWDDRRPLVRARDRIRPDEIADRRLYLAVANEGGTMQAGVDLLRSALSARAPASFQSLYSDRSATETHATVYHGAAHDALRRLYAAPPYDYGPTPWYMIEGAAPPAE